VTDVVLLAVRTPDGLEHSVAALADVPVRVLTAALVRLLTPDAARGSGAPHLVDSLGRTWSPDRTLRDLAVPSATEVDLVLT
jgi:hypothetical protein